MGGYGVICTSGLGAAMISLCGILASGCMKGSLELISLFLTAEYSPFQMT